MKILDPGHWYRLKHLDGSGTSDLTFVKRVNPPEKYPGNVGPPYEGTTIQEVLRALIDRGEYVNHQFQCEETTQMIAHLEQSLYLLEQRTRRERGQAPIQGIAPADMWRLPTCDICGHVQCLLHRGLP